MVKHASPRFNGFKKASNCGLARGSFFKKGDQDKAGEFTDELAEAVRIARVRAQNRRTGTQGGPAYDGGRAYASDRRTDGSTNKVG